MPKPFIVVAFDGVGEVGFEEFVALEEVANDWYFGPVVIGAFDGVSSYPAHPYGFCEVSESHHSHSPMFGWVHQVCVDPVLFGDGDVLYKVVNCFLNGVKLCWCGC